MFRLLCRPRPSISKETNWQYFQKRLLLSRRFFERLGPGLQLEGKSVLEVGSGRGSTCIRAALLGARRVVGVDIQEHVIEWAKRELLSKEYPWLASRVQFLATDGTLRELGGECFDVVISRDSFEHYEDPEGFVFVLKRHLKPGGVLAIGFGPLWKGPTGGHIYGMTKLPWAHLIFPEKVILEERNRLYLEEPADRFEDIPGGLNKMTLARFQTIMRSSGLECLSFETNVSANPVVKMMKLVSYLSFVREFFTANVYGVWRLPANEDTKARSAEPLLRSGGNAGPSRQAHGEDETTQYCSQLAQ